MHQRGLKADPIMLSDSKEVNQEVGFENNKNFNITFDTLLNEEQRFMT